MSAPASRSAGQPVSLKVEVAKVRFGTPEAARAAILRTLTERLAAEGIPITDGQPTVLHVAYSEGAGETLRELKGNGPIPGLGGGTPTGWTVQATTAQCLLAWEATGSKKPLWSDKLNFNPSTLMVSGEATDAKARESVFNALKYRLVGLPIPYFLRTSAHFWVTLERCKACASVSFEGHWSHHSLCQPPSTEIPS